MRPNNRIKTFALLGLLSFSSCSVADDVKDTFDAAECAVLLDRIDDNENDTCAEITSDINKLLTGSCREFLTEEQRADLEFIRDNCTDE